MTADIINNDKKKNYKLFNWNLDVIKSSLQYAVPKY